MKLTINADLEQIRKVMPIIDKMLEANFLTVDERVIQPFQYGEHNKEVAIIRCTKSGNIILDNFTPVIQSPTDAQKDKSGLKGQQTESISGYRRLHGKTFEPTEDEQ